MPRKKQSKNHGDGSVYRDKKRGDWIAQIYIDGRSIRRRAPTSEAAEQIRKELVTQRDRGLDIRQANQSVETFINTWFNEIVLERGLKPTTIRRYMTAIELHILPYIGNLSLQELKPATLQRWINALKQRKLSAGSINGAASILGDALKTARRWSLMDTNPIELIEKPPSRTQSSRQALSIAETQNLLTQAKAKELQLYVLLYLGLTLGPRANELLGLHWRDVDLDSRTIKITTQFQFVPRQGLLTLKPKTESGNRTIALSDTMVELLKEHWQQQQQERKRPDWKEHGLVFPNETGHPLRYKRMLSILGRLCKQAGIQRATMHILRHTASTRLAELRIDRAIIGAILGHSKKGTTDIYISASHEAMRAAVVDVEKLLQDNSHTQSHTRVG